MTDHVVLYPPGGGGPGGGSFSAGVSTGGNTAGTTGTVSNQILLVGSNNITLSQSSAAGGATVSIIGGAGGAGFSGGVSNLGNTAGSTGVTGTRLVLAGTNMVSLSQSTDANGGTVSINATQTVQTQGVLSIGVSTGGNTAGNTTVNTGSRLVLSGQANITLSQATAAGATTIGISAPSQTAQTGISGIANSQTTFTSGTVGLSELGAVTIRSTTGNQFQISVNAQTAQTGISSIVASDATYTSGSVQFTGSNIVTVRSSANQRVVIDASQSVQTQGVPSLGVSTGGNTSGDTGVNSGTRFVLVGSNNITLSQSTAANATTITISGGAGGAGMSAGLSTGGNTSGDTGAVTGRLVLAGGNNITLSGSTNGGSMTITVSAPNLGAGGAMSAGASNLGNTAGSTGITGTQLVLVGTGPVSLSQSTGANGGTLSINAPATSSLSATGAVSISTNGSTISIGVPPAETLNYWNPQDAYVQVTGAQGQATFHLQPAPAPNVTFDRVAIPMYFSGASNSTMTCSISHWFGLYTRNDSTFSLLSSVSSTTAFTHSGNNNASLYNGVRLFTMGLTGSIPEGQYYVGINFRSSTGGANATAAQILASQMNSNFSGVFAVASNASIQYTRGLGHLSASTTAIPSEIAASNLRGSASIALRQPIFYLVNGTL